MQTCMGESAPVICMEDPELYGGFVWAGGGSELYGRILSLFGQEPAALQLASLGKNTVCARRSGRLTV